MKVIRHSILLCLFLIFGFLGCEPVEEEVSSDPSLKLFYSTDTITFDTLFSSVGSITKRLKIYNQNDNAIELNRLSLGRNDQSPYSIIVNGERDKSFQNKVILGKDSLLVLVEVLIDPENQDLPFLVKDSLEIEYNSKSEDIKLVAWGQDAIFINNEAIECNTTWTNERPYVIYDSAWVASGCQLTVEAGTKIYLDNDAILTIVGSLQIEGTADEKVEISNTRLDQKYDIAPGQWGSLFFFPGSTGNRIDHTIIKNGTAGLTLAINLNNGEGAEIQVSNTSIQHMSQSGIVAYGGTVEAHNLEVFHCQGQLFAGLAGGSYLLNHCTFSNEPNDFIREGASVGFTNYLEFNDGSVFSSDLTLQLTNSIVWGREEEELALDISSSSSAILTVEGNIIRSSNADWATLNNQISLDDNYPGFYFPSTYDYQIDSISNARNKALPSLVTHDILGTIRDDMPDIGAFERKDSIP